MASTDLKDLGIFAENLAELQIKAVEVPQNIKIPNWPKEAGAIRIKLGKRDYIYPTKASETGMLCLTKKRHRVSFRVREDGTFRVDFWGFRAPMYSGTFENNNIERIRALELFHQFKEEILLKIIQKLKADLGNHNQVVAMVEKAIEPFVPFLVADQLSS